LEVLGQVVSQLSDQARRRKLARKRVATVGNGGTHHPQLAQRLCQVVVVAQDGGKASKQAR
jgi:hypothetical protein